MANQTLLDKSLVTALTADANIYAVDDVGGTPGDARIALPDLNQALGVVSPNILINSNLQDPINQRGIDLATGETVTSGDYTVDRWYVLHNVTTATIKQETGLRLTATTAGSGTVIQLAQKIEDYEALQGKTVTVSARVRSNTSAAYLEMYDGVGATTDAHTGGGGWEILTVTRSISASATADTRPSVKTNSSLSDGNYVEIDWIKLEVGPVATKWVVPDPAIELSRCERYYQVMKVNNHFVVARAINPTTAFAMMFLRTTMRVAPSVSLPSAGTGVGEIAFTLTNGSYPTIGSHLIQYNTVNSFNIRADSYGAGTWAAGDAINVLCNGNGEIHIDAEL